MRRRRYPNINLNSAQYAQVMDVAKSMPEPQRHSFLLQVSAKLQLACARQNLYPSDALLAKIVHDTLAGGTT